MATKRDQLDKRILAVSSKLRELRVKKGYKAYIKFAEDHDLGRMQYWRMETGTNFTMKSLLEILDIHNISLKDFFTKYYQEPTD
jgi:hypothetical protein